MYLTQKKIFDMARKELEACEYTQKEIADLFNQEESVVSRMFNHNQYPTLATKWLNFRGHNIEQVGVSYKLVGAEDTVKAALKYYIQGQRNRREQFIGEWRDKIETKISDAQKVLKLMEES